MRANTNAILRLSLAACIASCCIASRADEPAQPPAPTLLPAPRELAQLPGDTGGLLEFSPDGSLIVTADGSPIVSDTTSLAQLWDARTFKPIGRPLDHPHPNAAQFDARGTKLLTVGAQHQYVGADRVPVEGDARLWDARTGKSLLPPIDHDGRPLSTAAFSPDGTLIATCRRTDPTVRLVDATSGKRRADLRLQKPVNWLRFDPSGATLVVMAGTSISLWDVHSLSLCLALPEVEGEWCLPAISANGRSIAVLQSTFECRIYDLHTGRQTVSIDDSSLGKDQYLNTVALNADATCVATTANSSDEWGKVWSVKTRSVALTVKDGRWMPPVFSPDGQWVMFHVADGASLWELRSGRAVAWPAEYDTSLCRFSPDGKKLAIHTYRHYIAIVDLQQLSAPRR
jgi:WD40 repeat protein